MRPDSSRKPERLSWIATATASLPYSIGRHGQTLASGGRLPPIKSDMAEWRVERIDRSHHRADFRSGQASLDSFLHTLVMQYDKRGIGRTYVALQGDDKRVWGYYTLAAGAVSFQNLSAPGGKKLPRHPVPVALLARLAVDRTVQGQGLGRLLLMDALHRCLVLSADMGIFAVEVQAIDDTAKSFYEKYGFVGLLDDALHLYLPIATVAAGFPEPRAR